MNGKKVCAWLAVLAVLLSGCAAQPDDTYTQLENDALLSAGSLCSRVNRQRAKQRS